MNPQPAVEWGGTTHEPSPTQEAGRTAKRGCKALDRKIARRRARDQREGKLRMTRLILDRSVFDHMPAEEKILLNWGTS
jgi:hypothetical protein